MLENKTVHDYIIKNNVLFKICNGNELVVVPQSLQSEIIRDAHEKGHFAVQKTVDVLKQNFYFPKMEKRVEEFIQNCVKCILVNRKRGKGEGFLHPIPKDETPLSTFHCDFIGPLPSTSKQYNYIFSVVDAFTKFVWLYPTKSTSTQDAQQKL